MLHRRASHNKKILAMTEISCTYIVNTMLELCFVHTVWNQLISSQKFIEVYLQLRNQIEQP